MKDRLREIVEAVRIETDTKFRLGDESRKVDFLSPVTSNQDQYLESPLTHDLKLAIYEHYYTCLVSNPPSKRPTSTQQNDLLHTLRDANLANDDWDRGWRILGVTTNGVYVTKNPRVLFVPHGVYLLTSRVKELTEGELVDIRCHRDSDTIQPIFYFGFSSFASTTIGNRTSIRFYWNCSPTGAVEIVREASSRFNRFQIPYEVKCVTRPDFYGRRDSLVLYLKPPYARAAFEQIKRFYPAVSQHLEDPTPLFTRRIAPGLSTAETPPGNVSFGHHRCGFIASALVRAHAANISHHDRRMQFVLEAFEENHVSPERPWLSHGDHDPFGIGEFEIP